MNQRFPCTSDWLLNKAKLISYILCQMMIDNELCEMWKEAVVTYISRYYTGRTVRNWVLCLFSQNKFTCESVCFRRFDRDNVWASSDCSWQVIFEPSTDDTDFVTSAAGAVRKSNRVGILLSTPDGYSPIVTETGRCLPVSLCSLHVDWLVLLNTDWKVVSVYL
jgi:hypothetical protein